MEWMDGKIKIYYDGTCSMCSGVVNKIEKSSAGHKFESLDASDGNSEAGITQEDAMHEVYVLDEDGTMHKGADGIIKVLEQYPRWCLLARLGRLPVIKQLVNFGYRAVAANRHRF